jgi:hypothetical protein
MKRYVMTTGVVFALITVAHLLRMLAEWPRFVTDPFYVALTVATTALSLWAWRLLRVSPHGQA